MANIRVDALTEVATIADDDVVMVDGKQGVRATTWGTLKNLIKQQCGINELNTNIAGLSEQVGTTKILHATPNKKEWIELFGETGFGTAIIIMATNYDGAMFTVSKREGGDCFIQQIYNTGDYVCYKSPDEDVSSKVVLTVGHDGAYFTRDIIVIGSVK